MTWTVLTGAKTAAGSIRWLINYGEIDPESVLRDSENWIAQHLRVRRMRARAALTLSTGASSIDLETEVPLFLDPIRLWMQGYGKLTFIHEDEIDEARAADTDGALNDGCPTQWTISGSSLLLDTEADQSYQLVLSHYAKPEALSASNETNLYTETYPALLRAVATAYAYIEAKDEARATALFSHARAFIEQIAINDDLSRRGQEIEIEVT